MACLRILEQTKFTLVNAILPALNASPANKCQHKFQPAHIEHLKDERERENPQTMKMLRNSWLGYTFALLF